MYPPPATPTVQHVSISIYICGHVYSYKALNHTVRMDNHLPIFDLSLDSYPVDPRRPDADIVPDNLVVL